MRNTGQKMIAQLMQEHNGCLIFMDMDNLKKINDIYGHKAGDRALKVLGALLSEHIGNSVGRRFGGDEFLLFVPDAGKNEISELMETLFSRFDSEKKKILRSVLHPFLPDFACVPKEIPLTSVLPKQIKHSIMSSKTENTTSFLSADGQYRIPGFQRSKRSFLVAKALRNSGNYSGALNLNYREFSKIYEYINQLENDINTIVSWSWSQWKPLRIL